MERAAHNVVVVVVHAEADEDKEEPDHTNLQEMSDES